MRAVAVSAVLLLGGCVYYNGVYNAKRLTHAAERAERDGRTIEARDYWAQVVVKADTVIARHPASTYIPQVQLLRARALGRMDQCSDAVPALRQALPAAADSAAVEAGTFELARCLARLGDVAGSAEAYARLTSARDPLLRNEARFQYVHALRLSGSYQAALDAAANVADPRLPAERMVALAGAGRISEALPLADSAIARGDTTAPWDSLLSAGGRRDAAGISALVDRLRALPTATPAMKSQWLLDDGLRLMASDSVRGDARLAEAAAAGPGTEPAGRARLLRAERRLARARTSADLALVVDTLEALRDVPGARARAALLAYAVTRLRAASDSTAAGAPRADLALFLAAETARDALGIPSLAEVLFRRLVDERPDSPYAPKAVLALHQLDPDAVPEFTTLLDRYAASPYMAALRGEVGPGLRLLEDSLSRFAESATGGREGAQPRPGQGEPAAPGTRRPVEPR
jgi:hypothetical protein